MVVFSLSLKVTAGDNHHKIISLCREYKSGNGEKVQKKELVWADIFQVWAGIKGSPRGKRGGGG